MLALFSGMRREYKDLKGRENREGFGFDRNNGTRAQSSC